jgi:hypothetical protein
MKTRALYWICGIICGLLTLTASGVSQTTILINATESSVVRYDVKGHFIPHFQGQGIPHPRVE